MLTSAQEVINSFSPKLMKELKDAFDAAPPKIKYRFDIGRKDPDPDKPPGTLIYNSIWTLEPVTYHIQDDGQTKRVGLIDSYDREQRPNGYKRIILKERERGILTLKKTDFVEAFNTFCYLELHPTMKGGKNYDENFPALFERINEARDAKQKSHARKLKSDAISIATSMSTQDELDFAAGMGWDEDMDPEVLHNDIGELAENNPQLFSDIVTSKNLEVRAIIKRAETHEVIEWNQEEFKYVWASTKQTIVLFGRKENLDRLEAMADWLISKPDILNKIKAQLKAEGVKS